MNNTNPKLLKSLSIIVCSILISFQAFALPEPVAEDNDNYDPYKNGLVAHLAKFAEAAYEHKKPDPFYVQGVRRVHSENLFSVFQSGPNTDRCFIAFKGTAGLPFQSEWRKNLRSQFFLKTSLYEFLPYARSNMRAWFKDWLDEDKYKGTKVPRAYAELHRSLYTRIIPLVERRGCLDLIVTGHSQGAALAQLFVIYHFLDDTRNTKDTTRILRSAFYNSPKIINEQGFNYVAQVILPQPVTAWGYDIEDGLPYAVKVANYCRKRDPVRTFLAGKNKKYRINYNNHKKNFRGCSLIADYVSSWDFAKNHNIDNWY